MATPQNFSFDQGEDWIFSHTALEPDGVTPFTLSGGAVLELQIATPTDQVVVAPSAVTVTVTSPAAGQSTIWIPSATTSQIAVGVYQYTLRIITAAGLVFDLNSGSWTVNATAFSA